jgi:hypothetical protein
MWDVESGGKERQPCKTITMFIAVRMDITDQGSTAYLMNTGKNSIHSWLA